MLWYSKNLMPEKNKEKRKLNTKVVVKIFWNQTWQHPWLFGLSLFGIALNQLSNIIGPVFMRNLFNLLATLDRSPTAIHALTTILIIYAVISLIGWWGGRMEMWLGYTLISKVTAKLTKEAFTNLIRHSYQFFTNSFSGGLTRRVSRFAGAYENLYYSGVTMILEGVLYLAGVGIVLALHNWILGALVSVWVVVFVILQWFLNRIQHPYRVARANADTDVTASLADAITNQNTVALFSANRHEEKLVAKAADTYQRAQLRSWNLNSFVYGFQGLLTNALNIGMLTVGVWLWVQGTVTLGDVVLIQAYVFGIFSTVWSFGRQFNTIYNSLADASEMVETMETPLEVADKKGAKKLKVTNGEIWFDDVSFHFNPQKEVLKTYNLKIARGEKLALVGPSGAGKTTVTKLLLRLFDVKRGNIVIDGQNIAEVTQDSLRDTVTAAVTRPIPRW